MATSRPPRPTPADPDTALPSVAARAAAFAAILVGGAAGGLIGYAFGDLGGFGSVMTGVLTLAFGLGCAGGVAVVAVLTLRALGEWKTIRARGDATTS
jgi:hypothetical protein